MKFLEKDLEDIIFDNIQSKEGLQKLEDKGLYINRPIYYKRQLKIGNYGVADIVSVSKLHEDIASINGNVAPYLCIEILELKKDKVDLNTLMQCVRYYKGVKQYLKFRGFDKNHSCIKLNLIGLNVDVNSDWIYLFDYLESTNEGIDISDCISIYEYSYGIDGIEFDSINLSQYSLVDEGFESNPF